MAAGEAGTYPLVYPGQAGFEEGKLSVPGPLGSAILEERVGEVVRVHAPAGTRSQS